MSDATFVPPDFDVPKNLSDLERQWVRASRAELELPPWQSVSDWIAAGWPFRSVEYAERPG
jgi:hypothetical protein